MWEALPLSLISVLPRETSCSGIRGWDHAHLGSEAGNLTARPERWERGFSPGCIPHAVNFELCLCEEAAHTETLEAVWCWVGCPHGSCPLPWGCHHGMGAMQRLQRKMCWASRCVEFGKDGCSSCFLLISTGQDGHQDPLTCVASNQDGSLILTGSVDCHAKLVNSATGKVSPCPPVGRSSGHE